MLKDGWHMWLLRKRFWSWNGCLNLSWGACGVWLKNFQIKIKPFDSCGGKTHVHCTYIIYIIDHNCAAHTLTMPCPCWKKHEAHWTDLNSPWHNRNRFPEISWISVAVLGGQWLHELHRVRFSILHIAWGAHSASAKRVEIHHPSIFSNLFQVILCRYRLVSREYT